MSARVMHGNKRRFQVLLDPNRAKLFDALAEQDCLKTSAFLRNRLYEALESLVPRAAYERAKEADAALKAESSELQSRIRRSRK